MNQLWSDRVFPKSEFGGFGRAGCSIPGVIPPLATHSDSARRRVECLRPPIDRHVLAGVAGTTCRLRRRRVADPANPQRLPAWAGHRATPRRADERCLRPPPPLDARRRAVRSRVAPVRGCAYDPGPDRVSVHPGVRRSRRHRDRPFGRARSLQRGCRGPVLLSATARQWPRPDSRPASWWPASPGRLLARSLHHARVDRMRDLSLSRRRRCGDPPARASSVGGCPFDPTHLSATGDRQELFVGYALSGGLASAALFSYISGSPFVLQEIYDVSPQTYQLHLRRRSRPATSLAARSTGAWSAGSPRRRCSGSVSSAWRPAGSPSCSWS